MRATAPLAAPHDLRSVDVLGVPVHDVSLGQALDRVVELARAGTPSQVATVNTEFVMLARRDPEFLAVLRRSALRVPDGAGIVWQARRRGARAGERVAGVDLLAALGPRLAAEDLSLFLLGAPPGVAELAASRLRETSPGLTIAGTHSGSPRSQDEEEILALLRAARPHVLAVAYGTPAQEFWLDRNLKACGIPVGIGVGGALDLIAGFKPRAPRWMREAGMEWVFRLAREPWRARRMTALPAFVLAALTERAA